MSINTPQNWWTTLDENWADLLQITCSVGVPLSKFHEETQGTNGDPLEPLMVFLERTKKRQDHDTMWLFWQRVWAAAPDSSKINSWPGWGTLCELCSEDWVFQDEERQEGVEVSVHP